MKKTLSLLLIALLVFSMVPILIPNVVKANTAPIPTITSIEPAEPKAKPTRQWLAILGGGFLQESKVTLRFDSSEYPIPQDRTVYKTPDRIEVFVGLTESGIWEVWVENPGNLKSNIFSFKVTLAVIDEELLNLVEQYAGSSSYFNGEKVPHFNEEWNLSLDQYKTWIVTIAWGEGKMGGYVAHSQAFKSDMFYHKEVDDKFRFSTGMGLFQLDRGGEPENWHNWTTIEKLNPEKALKSVMRWHFRNFGTGATLKDFSEESVWYAVKSNYYNSWLGRWVWEEFVKARWKEVTGTEWDDYKNGENKDLKWLDVVRNIGITNDPKFSYKENVKKVGKLKWSVTFTTDVGEEVSFDGYYDTWLINARNSKGTKLFDYYYTHNDTLGCEVWVWNNIGEEDEFRYIFVRNYTKTEGQYPEHAEKDLEGKFTGYAGEDKLDTPALYLPRNVDVVLVIDRSGSMWGTKITEAKWAAKQFVDLMQVGDKIGVVSFASTVRVDYSLSEILPATFVDSEVVFVGTKTIVKGKIDLIYASGMTAMGDGLRTAYNQLVNYGDPSHPWAIVLMSNGWHNWGIEHPYSVIPDLRIKDIRVYTIGLGAGAQEDLLKRIAKETGGLYHFAPEPEDLREIYNRIAARVALAQTVSSASGLIDQGQTTQLSVNIDSSVTQATFTISWGGSDLDLTLIRPDGTLIDPSVAAINPDIEYIEEARYEIYRINNPMAGTWQMVITAITVPPQGERFFAQVTALTSVTLTLATDKDSYTYPEPVKIMVTLEDAGIPLTGADVKAFVAKPDTSQIILTLFDDGSDIHGDISSNDGVYTNYFSQFNEDGSYTVKVVAIGTTLIGESFSREDQKTVLVSGIPFDTTPPTTTLFINSPQYIDATGNLYVTSSTPFMLSAVDNNGAGSGVATTTYRIYNATYDSRWITYTAPFYIMGLNDGAYGIDYNSTDNAGNVEPANTETVILDNTPPLLTIERPSEGAALQDVVTLKVSAWDLSAVASVIFSIQCAQGNVISPEFESMPATHSPEGKWELRFNTSKLPDGLYLFVADGTDVLGNTGAITVEFSIRNWACIELLPASESNKAGRTMPVKFSIRINATVDPDQPFVWNEELTIIIYEKGHPETILQNSTYGDTARDYRIDPEDELYITNFKTLKTPKTYVVEIWRKGVLIGTFEFSTVK